MYFLPFIGILFLPFIGGICLLSPLPMPIISDIDLPFFIEALPFGYGIFCGIIIFLPYIPALVFLTFIALDIGP
jgi:hypothetical protein